MDYNALYADNQRLAAGHCGISNGELVKLHSLGSKRVKVLSPMCGGS